MINVYEEKLRKKELLRAAAPEMYEALTEVSTLLALEYGSTLEDCKDTIVCKAKAAIAKAEGKA